MRGPGQSPAGYDRALGGGGAKPQAFLSRGYVFANVLMRWEIGGYRYSMSWTSLPLASRDQTRVGSGRRPVAVMRGGRSSREGSRSLNVPVRPLRVWER